MRQGTLYFLHAPSLRLQSVMFLVCHSQPVNTVEELCRTSCVVVLVVQRSVIFICGRVCVACASSSKYTHCYIVRKI